MEITYSRTAQRGSKEKHYHRIMIKSLKKTKFPRRSLHENHDIGIKSRAAGSTIKKRCPPFIFFLAPCRVLSIGATPLMHACQQADRARVLKLLRDQEETIGYRDRALRSALHYCMDAGTGGAVAQAAPELVDAPDAEGHTPLHLAVIAGDTQLVAVLLANGADVNAKDLEGHSVLHWATGLYSPPPLFLLLSPPPSVSMVNVQTNRGRPTF